MVTLMLLGDGDKNGSEEVMQIYAGLKNLF
jgi:hypothetical protein